MRKIGIFLDDVSSRMMDFFSDHGLHIWIGNTIVVLLLILCFVFTSGVKLSTTLIVATIALPPTIGYAMVPFEMVVPIFLQLLSKLILKPTKILRYLASFILIMVVLFVVAWYLYSLFNGHEAG